MRAYERRAQEWNILRERKFVHVADLAAELSVSPRTIKSDIAFLAVTFPIEMVRGRYDSGIKLGWD